MNLVENYIEEIHSVEEVDRQSWMREPYVRVDMTVDCYGRITREAHHYPVSEWEKIKTDGYYMG